MRVGRRALFTLVSLLPLLFGCGGSSSNNTANLDPNRVLTTSGRYKALLFTGSTRAVYNRGETVAVTFTVKNTSDQNITFAYGGCYAFYANVRSGNRLIDYADGASESGSGCTGNIKGGSFPAQSTTTFTVYWQQKRKLTEDGQSSTSEDVPAGQYTIAPQLSVYNLNEEQFLMPQPRGIVYPQRMGPEPLTIQIR